MELSRFTDYSLRTLIYAGIHSDRIITVPEVAQAYGLSQNHLVKIAHKLGKAGFLEVVRGRYGGFRLGSSPDQINLGEVVRACENLALVECLSEEGGSCPINGACVLKGIIREARDAFLETFDRYTLADLIRSKKAMLEKLGVE